jgi:hypothetical protein
MLWKESELIGMGETITYLRRIRAAAVIDRASLSFRMKILCNNILRRDVKIRPQQEALSDAEKLADAGADFFAARISNTRRGNREFEKWMDLLSDAKKHYHFYRPLTFAKTKTIDVAGFLINSLRTMYIDPEYTIDFILFKWNNFGTDSIRKLLELNVGVFSPLSGDYLVASTISHYLQRTRSKSFPVSAVALSKDLSFGVLQVNKDGGRPFKDRSAISIFMDNNETGSTANSMLKILRSIYPDKTIYEPQTERIEFVQSDKIKAYYKE